MAELSVQDMAAKLLSDGFKPSARATGSLSDPIADTPMVVTLDELRPYELDPRLTRNPLYDEIKASIRERGLDAPPPITRRPGADHFIIRNGGNTRLAVLRELWAETHEERFYRIACLFRPWPERGEIVALTGHLAENELHGGLSFIERALGVAKVRELYEAETGKALSQSELARRLRADGYPVPQPHISRMQEAIEYLLPAIPNVLYAGLGRPQVEQLTALRRWAGGIWETRGAGQVAIDFPTLFQDVLAGFDDLPARFSVPRVKDELIGRMADQLGVNYDTLAFEVDDREQRWQVLNAESAAGTPKPAPAPAGEPAAASPRNPPAAPPPAAAPRLPADTATPAAGRPPEVPAGEPASNRARPPAREQADPEDPVDDAAARLRGHIVTPAASTDRLQAIQQLIAAHADEDAAPDFAGNVVRAIPVQAGGLYPIADVWYIEPALDDPARLRLHIGQLAVEIAGEAGLGEGAVVTGEAGIGFACAPDASAAASTASAPVLLALLDGLSASRLSTVGSGGRRDRSGSLAELGPLLLGGAPAGMPPPFRLGDAGLVKLFRLIRLARRLLEREAAIANGGHPPADA